MYARVLVALLVLLVAGSLVGGCGGASSEKEPHKTGTSGDLSVYEVPGEHFSIGVPASWSALSPDRVFKGGSLETFVADNPDMKGLADAMRGPNALIKFLAFDPAVERGFATNANVIVETVPSWMKFDDYVQASLEQLRAAAFVSGSVQSEEVSLPGGRAEKLSYLADFNYPSGKRTVAILQYALLRAAHGYVISFSTLPDRTDEYAATFRRSAETFRIKP